MTNVKENQSPAEKKCAYKPCRKSFTPKRSFQRYCSRKCGWSDWMANNYGTPAHKKVDALAARVRDLETRLNKP